MNYSTFSISAPPSTDIWRKPPSTNSFNATFSHTSRGTLRSFLRAIITVTLPPRPELILYDQGGLLLSITRPGADLVEASTSQWLKTGIEFYLGQPWIGTVGCDRWADWSIASVPGGNINADDRPFATIEVERSSDELGKSLWVYLLHPGTENVNETVRTPLREVNWVFADEMQDWELTVSAYAARPQRVPGNEAEELKVDFESLKVEWI